METSDGLEFVNRGAELAFLDGCLRRAGSPPVLIIIRSPPGFGKSRLTDHFKAQSNIPSLHFCIVDPSIRARTGSARLHDGYFFQRCAAELTSMAEAQKAQWPTLSAFLKKRRWKTILERRRTDAFSELPSFGHGYRIAFDYAARIFGWGRYSVTRLLTADQSDAVRICVDYAEYVLTTHPICLVVREVQHSDLESLRNLLHANSLSVGPRLLLEYTSDNGQFEPEHQKFFLRTAEAHRNFHILDLFRLEPEHLSYLIRRNVKSDFALTSDFYLSWNGNLRSIIELKFQIGIGRRITSADQIRKVLGNLTETLDQHIHELAPLHRLILSLVLAHVEAIDRSTLTQMIGKIDPRATSGVLSKALVELVGVHGFLAQGDNAYRIQNETIATSLANASSIQPLLAIAEKALRDYYAQLIERAAYIGVGLSAAVRQLFRLCARTRDAAGLVRATETLSAEVRRSQDQLIYVDVVAGAIEADPSLYAKDHTDLMLWAACLAYELCDWERVEKLLVLKSNQDGLSRAMRACALQEIGRHDEALLLVSEIDKHATHSDERLAAKLMEAIIIGCQGQHDEARAKLNSLIGDLNYLGSPLLGYAYRFFEVIADLNECVERLRVSIELFSQHGFEKSKAYSELSTAVLVARTGDLAGGRSLIAEAQRVLAGEVRDQHMILNNGAAIELLDDRPDFRACSEKLLTALRYARDDYSELTILTNLAISYWGAEELPSALECVDRILGILRHHDFADQDIYWPVCFNASRILAAAQLVNRSDEVLRFPREKGRQVTVNRGYWAYRYGEVTDLDGCYAFLASRRHHPLYLSHWLIDLDGLNLLKQARLQ
jgi:tetratricopeptide (TPR) repeat protein